MVTIPEMWAVIFILCLTATPEILALTVIVLLSISLSVTINSPVPTEVFVQTPEKQAEIARQKLSGVKFSADGKVIFETTSAQDNLNSSQKSK